MEAQHAAALTVLVVEDESMLRFNIISYLRDSGFIVVEAESGEQAIAFIRSGQAIDLLITDINLGGPTTGWQVAECCRVGRPGLPVIYTSGKVIEAERRVAGSVAIAKPYRLGDILSACERLSSP